MDNCHGAHPAGTAAELREQSGRMGRQGEGKEVFVPCCV